MNWLWTLVSYSPTVVLRCKNLWDFVDYWFFLQFVPFFFSSPSWDMHWPVLFVRSQRCLVLLPLWIELLQQLVELSWRPWRVNCRCFRSSHLLFILLILLNSTSWPVNSFTLIQTVIYHLLKHVVTCVTHFLPLSIFKSNRAFLLLLVNAFAYLGSNCLFISRLLCQRSLVVFRIRVYLFCVLDCFDVHEDLFDQGCFNPFIEVVFDAKVFGQYFTYPLLSFLNYYILRCSVAQVYRYFYQFFIHFFQFKL